MAQRMDVRVGMQVKSRDGHKLGQVIGLAADAFVVEKGVFYARDYRVPFRSVERIEGDDIHLSLNRDQLQKASLEEVLDAADRMDIAQGSLTEARMDSAKFQNHEQYDVDAAGAEPRIAPHVLIEARMDSAKFQDHEQYDVRTEEEKEREAEESRPIGFDPNAPSHY